MNRFTLSFLYRNLAPYLKAVFTSGADHGVLALCLGEPQHRLALGTFAVYVGFSVLPFVFAKLEKSAEFFVFLASLVYVS